MLSFLRTIKFSLQDMMRNFSQTITTISILVLMLLSINTLVVMRFLTKEATDTIKNQIDVSVFFVEDATDDQIAEVERYVSSFPEVTDVKLYSREEVLDNFRAEYSDNPDILEALQELDSNPLGATMIVKTRDPKSYEKVITLLTVPEYEDIVVAKTFTDTERAIARIDRITRQIERFSLILTAIFAVISFLVIFNTVRTAIDSHRIEISIKKLVGATNWFVRGPYIISAWLYSLISLGISSAMVSAVAGFIDLHIEVVFGKPGLLTDYFNSHILLIFGGQFLALIVFTVLASLLAMRRFLRA
jgi:cell division transport system permease protein